jgi:hypothetical protein
MIYNQLNKKEVKIKNQKERIQIKKNNLIKMNK